MLISPNNHLKTKGEYVFTADVTATAHSVLANGTLSELWNGFCCTAGNISFKETDEPVFILGDGEIVSPENYEYAINITEKGVAISAVNENSLIHGFMTLHSMIKPLNLGEGEECFSIECGKIYDKANVKQRMLHFCVMPTTSFEFFKKYIRLCGVLKYTHVILEFWGTLKLDSLQELAWKEAFSKEQVSEIFKEAEAMGISLVPCFNHLGHASSCRSIHGKHVVLDQNPRLSMLFDPDGWTWDILNPDTKSLHKKVRDELLEIFGDSEYFVIGCDEAPLYENDSERAKILCDYLNEVAHDLKQKGVRPIMWADMLLHGDTVKKRYAGDFENYICNSKNGEIAEYLLNNLDRYIILGDWQYEVKKIPIVTTDYLMSFGFDVINCPWYQECDDTMRAHAETARQNKVYATMMTTWNSGCIPGALFYAQLCEEETTEYRESVKAMPVTAMLLRKVYFADGDYKNAGWRESDF